MEPVPLHPAEQQVLDEAQLSVLFSAMEAKCQQIDSFEDPGMPHLQIIANLLCVQNGIKQLRLFSPNESVKEVQTEHLRYLALPYLLGFLFNRLSHLVYDRRSAVLQSKSYLSAYLKLLEMFNCEDEHIFPEGALNTWRHYCEEESYKMTRDELVRNMKEKKLYELRFKNAELIKDEGDRRQCLKDYLSLRTYEAISQLKTIEEELLILQYQETIAKDPVAKEAHEQEQSKPVPKLKVWEIKKPAEIQACMCPDTINSNAKKELIAQVWQENANKPTMTLEEVGELEYQNMMQREQRQKREREANREDTDSDKEEVDDRMKKKARAWDDWKDENEKGAGNRNGR